MRLPTTSAARQPYMRSAQRFQCRMSPSRSVAITACSTASKSKLMKRRRSSHDCRPPFARLCPSVCLRTFVNVVRGMRTATPLTMLDDSACGGRIVQRSDRVPLFVAAADSG